MTEYSVTVTYKRTEIFLVEAKTAQEAEDEALDGRDPDESFDRDETVKVVVVGI